MLFCHTTILDFVVEGLQLAGTNGTPVGVISFEKRGHFAAFSRLFRFGWFLHILFELLIKRTFALFECLLVHFVVLVGLLELESRHVYL